jgi:hypothetical protein
LGSIKFLICFWFFFHFRVLHYKHSLTVAAILDFWSSKNIKVLEGHIRNIPIKERFYHTCGFEEFWKLSHAKQNLPYESCRVPEWNENHIKFWGLPIVNFNWTCGLWKIHFVYIEMLKVYKRRRRWRWTLCDANTTHTALWVRWAKHECLINKD